jgi:hypothetical protein
MRKSIKLISSIVLLGIFIFIAAGSLEEDEMKDGIKSAASYDDAIKEVDKLFDFYSSEYNKICSGPRNHQTEKKFLDLAENLLALSQIGGTCKNLDSDVQLKVSDYANKKINADEDIKSVLFGTGAHPKCW